MALAAISSLFGLVSPAVGATVAHKAVLVDVGGVLTFGSISRALLGQGSGVCRLSGLDRTENCQQLVRVVVQEFRELKPIFNKSSTPVDKLLHSFTH